MSSVVRERWSQDPSWCVCQTHYAPHSWQLPPIHRAGQPAIVSPRALAMADWSRNTLLAHVDPSSLSQEVDIATEPLSWTFHGRTLGRGPLPLAAEASSIAQALSLLLAPVDSPRILPISSCSLTRWPECVSTFHKPRETQLRQPRNNDNEVFSEVVLFTLRWSIITAGHLLIRYPDQDCHASAFSRPPLTHVFTFSGPFLLTSGP